ncbi:NAD(P)-dependent dehydrogenase (short-subunit alcohol dehydrogenase family) [Streptomyces puniciscabiei]|uniref:NAD(P)-dependent dehydrogenase (Short-subunit alcohol dehydrogenase family) n=1 Tax=Streptomyces puniciscabiei TaxID=164348 RepID=A0A542UF24_9ACTN|nr:SDR family NAD(P)-dependent oxidoreductase [Streptomyces puniciscabiei]TQK97681.1 NAD(P)-dependent dehydrogenase (short-subunit alcohol dehydrogenase family) [Streptomyces puniciscabiei]
MDTKGRIALVAGGTSGLGRAVAERLLAAGAEVVVMGRDAERGRAATAELGGGASFVAGDITDQDDVAAAVAEAERRGGPHIVVNCAGATGAGRVVGRAGPLPLAEFARLVQVNLIGAFDLVRTAAAAMTRRPHADEDEERGVIVCTSSIAAYDGQQGQAAYAASKAGVVGMTLPLARDLAVHAVRVVTVAPGLFDTPMFAGLPERVRGALVGGTPYPRRLGRPEEFAALVQHIVENPMINGEVVRLDGASRLATT